MKFKQFTIPLGKILHTSVMATILRLVLQLIIPDPPEGDLMHFFRPSWFVEHGFMLPSFVVFMIIYLFIISLVIIRYDSGTDDYPIGMITLLLAVIWSVYLLEPLPQLQYGMFFTSGLVPTLKYVIADSATLIIFGLMLHSLVRVMSWTKDINLYKNEYSNADIKSSQDLMNEQLEELKSFIPILYYYPVYVIPVMLMRVLIYPTDIIFNDFARRPVQTIVWILIMTLMNFLIYTNLLRKYRSSMTNYYMPAFLLLVVNIVFFNLFMLLVVRVPIADLLLRSFIDYVPLLLVNILTNKRRIKI